MKHIPEEELFDLKTALVNIRVPGIFKCQNCALSFLHKHRPVGRGQAFTSKRCCQFVAKGPDVTAAAVDAAKQNISTAFDHFP